MREGEFYVIYDVCIDRYLVPNWNREKNKMGVIWPQDISPYHGTGMHTSLVQCYNTMINIDFDCDNVNIEDVIIVKGAYQDKYFIPDFTNPVWVGRDDG
jgi:hypothetical protein